MTKADGLLAIAVRVCPTCDGRGWHYQAPRGVNPFNVRLPTLARMLEQVDCRDCRNSRALAAEKV